MSKNVAFTFCFLVLPLVFFANMASHKHYNLKAECDPLQRFIPALDKCND